MTPENGKNDTKYDERNSKQPTSCWVSDFVPGDFFVGIVKLHKCTDFVHVRETSSRRTPLNIYRWRCRAICHTLLNPYQT